jgi:hypothetical protein
MPLQFCDEKQAQNSLFHHPDFAQLAAALEEAVDFVMDIIDILLSSIGTFSNASSSTLALAKMEVPQTQRMEILTNPPLVI